MSKQLLIAERTIETALGMIKMLNADAEKRDALIEACKVYCQAALDGAPTAELHRAMLAAYQRFVVGPEPHQTAHPEPGDMNGVCLYITPAGLQDVKGSTYSRTISEGWVGCRRFTLCQYLYPSVTVSVMMHREPGKVFVCTADALYRIEVESGASWMEIHQALVEKVKAGRISL